MMALSYKKRRYFKASVIVLILLLFFLILNVFSQRVRNFTYIISTPAQKILWQIGGRASGFLSPFFMVNELNIENKELVLENQELLLQNTELENLKQENQTLRDALEVGFKNDFEIIYSEIISKDVSEDYILIDKGLEDGVAVGMPVINQQRVLFGKVSDVYKNFSRIFLISNKNFVFDIKIQDKNIFGVVRGSGNLNLYLELIQRDSDLKEGDVLMTSALKGSFPKNLLIGQVSFVKKEDTKPFQEAEVKPFFDLKTTDSLFVITNFKN